MPCWFFRHSCLTFGVFVGSAGPHCRGRRCAITFTLWRLIAELASQSSILLHEDVGAPLTCGVLHPAIVMPSDAQEWSESDLRCAIGA